MAGQAIELRDLTKSFGRSTALDGISFDVPRNTIFGLLGPNGAGKTTLFSLVAGFLRPSRGSVKVLDVDVQRISELRGRLSILPQDALFQANVPVVEQMIFFCQLSGYTRAEAETEAMRALSIVGLADAAQKNARVLSHGMAKRMGIAQAFLGKPEVILLDEPTAGLDPENARGIRDLIRQLQTTATLIISSHNLHEIQEMCSHVAILDRAKLVECNLVSAITQAGTKIRMTFARALTPAELQAVLTVPGVARAVQGTPPELELAIELDASRSTEQLIPEIVQRLVTTGLVPRSVNEGVTLESKFLDVTRGKN